MLVRSLIVLTIISFSGCGLRENDDEPEERVYDIYATIEHDGETRTYHIHLPPQYYDNKDLLPVIFGFHGGGGSADNFEQQTQLSEKADAENFITVYADGLPVPGFPNMRTWNAGKCCPKNGLELLADDVGFISRLIDVLPDTYRIDRKRIYATGHSNGAMLCYRMADELSTKIAAIAPNAGNLQIDNPYDPVRNVPVLNIISKLDKSVKYNGGYSEGPGGHYNPPTDSCLNVVAAKAGCEISKALVQTYPLYSIYSWNTCDITSFEVLLYLTEDGGHSWPQGNKGSIIGDVPSQAFNNNDVIWEFLKQYSLP